MSNATVAVVGAGVVGVSIARGLAMAGADVTVFDRTGIGTGTSGRTFAWVNSHHKNPRPYHDLNVAGMAAHRELAVPDGGARWFFPTGNHEWADDDAGRERLAASTRELSERGYAVTRLTADQARRRLPDLLVPPGIDEIVCYPEEGYVLPGLLLARLWGEARDHGARLRCPDEVAGIDTAGSTATVRTAAGETWTGDRVVLAGGRWTGELTGLAGRPMAVRDPNEPGDVVCGFLGYTEPVPTRLNAVLTTPRINVRPDGGGRLVLQTLDLDHRADPLYAVERSGPVGQEMLHRLHRVLAGTDGAALSHIAVGQRAMPADGRTAAGFLDDRTYAVCTHSGITLSVLLGRIVAEEVLRDRRSPLLSGFEPDRLLDTTTAAFPDLPRAQYAGQQ
ncbi:FAD-binding oxidoreductase [Actinoallomurus oryzae]|uniref:FAD-binding oxidoreductase n=1 Tax=Actinoallomurus oryzae TaxID=502180 RepID=A0ABP8Q244_9ACTN